jgi:hypothetical protein
VSTFTIGAEVAEFEMLEESWVETRLSPTTRRMRGQVYVATLDDWEILSNLATDVDAERVPGGDYHVQAISGAGAGTLVLDNRLGFGGTGTYTGYLTKDPQMTWFDGHSQRVFGSVEFLTTEGPV